LLYYAELSSFTSKKVGGYSLRLTPYTAMIMMADRLVHRVASGQLATVKAKGRKVDREIFIARIPRGDTLESNSQADAASPRNKGNERHSQVRAVGVDPLR